MRHGQADATCKHHQKLAVVEREHSIPLLELLVGHPVDLAGVVEDHTTADPDFGDSATTLAFDELSTFEDFVPTPTTGNADDTFSRPFHEATVDTGAVAGMTVDLDTFFAHTLLLSTKSMVSASTCSTD